MSCSHIAEQIEALEQRLSQLRQQGCTGEQALDLLAEALQGFRAHLQDFAHELRQSETRYRTLVEQVPAMVYTGLLGEDDGTLLYVSSQVEAILGFTQAECLSNPRFWHEHLHPDDRGRVLAEFAGMCATGKVTTREYRMTAADGRVIWIRDEATVIRDKQGRPSLIQGVAMDITDRVQAEQALRESEAKYRSIVENTHDVIMLTRADGTITYMSPATREVLGCEPEELLGKRPAIVHPQDGDRLAEIHKRILQGQPGTDLEYRAVTRNGETRWVSHSWSFIPGSPFQTVVSVIRDITERKKAQVQIERHEAQLQALASELILAEERERRRIAVDLHDDLGQKIAVARIRLTMLKRFAAGTDLEAPISQILQVIDEAMESSRSLTFQICPPALYDLGLLPAAEWLAEDMQQRFGLHVQLTDDGRPKPMDERVRVVLFRCLRELLINVAKHAGVTEAVVAVQCQDDVIQLSVADKGCGFDLTQAAIGTNRSGFGLFSIQERLGYLGGEVRIHSVPGQGTTITLRVPARLANSAGPEEPP